MVRWQGNKPVIGLAGGIGSGKSTVAQAFASLDCSVIDADRLAQQTLEEPAVIGQLRQWWGDGVIGSDGRVDRKAVSRLVFEDPQQRKRLEDLVHPIVLARRAALRKQYDQDAKIKAIVDDTPLLFERGLQQECDIVVFVDAPLEVRRARVRAARGWSDEELDRRQQNQTPLDIKARNADYVIDNSADPAHCLEQVRRILSLILER